jgi:hypothetical protein
MAKTTPARITYMLGDNEQVIRFHTVISEEHHASSEVTKFPVQTGFQISNHAIRHNRKVSIEAVISNMLVDGGKTSYQYSTTDNSKTIFKALNDLVNLKISTTVLTNLGIYTPVIFTNFKTKQQAGMVDSMKIILSGEEIQESTALNSVSPTPLSWRTLSVDEAIARAEDLRDAGIEISESAASKPGFFEEANYEMGSDFSIEGVDVLGAPTLTTYINKGVDIVTGDFTYEIHASDIALYIPPDNFVVASLTDVVANKVKAGIKNAVGCIVKGGKDILIDAADDYVNTAMGKLKKSIYGAVYGVTNLTSNPIGQALLGMSTGCIIRGATGFADTFPYKPGESLPSSTDIVDGAIGYGKKKLVSGAKVTAAGIVTVPTILTRFK